MPDGGAVLDIGAGINPLVPLLCRLGYRVTTVDTGAEIDSVAKLAHTNEWGYFDYTHLGLDVIFVHGSLAAVPAEMGFDAIISISVIEHLHASLRRQLLHEMRARCHPGARLILTVDIAAGGYALWNRAAGVQVEADEEHGDWWGLLHEVSSAGFETIDARVVRLDGRIHVDIGLVVARPKVSA
jgi:SAM-dependent methyltransferase